MVTPQQGEQLSQRHGCTFRQLSAIDDKTDVSKVIYDLSKQILIRGGLIKKPRMFQKMVEAVRRQSGHVADSIDVVLPAVKEDDTTAGSRFLDNVKDLKETHI